MTRPQLTTAIIVGKLWLILAELVDGAYSQSIWFEPRQQFNQDCPDGNCPLQQQPQFSNQPNWRPLQQQQDAGEGPDRGAPPNVVRIGNDINGRIIKGTGTIVDGGVLTCAHLFGEGVGSIAVRIPTTGETVRAQLVEQDPDNDLAFLSIPSRDLPIVPVAETNPPIGEDCTAGGYGENRIYRGFNGRVVTYGSSWNQREGETLEISGIARQGDSGGPILNSRGELVAVLSFTGEGKTGGTACERVRTFLGRFGWRGRRSNLKPVAPYAPQAPSEPDRVAPSDAGRQPNEYPAQTELTDRIAELERQLSEANNAKSAELAETKGELDRLRNRPPVVVPPLPPQIVEKEKIVEVPGPERIIEKVINSPIGTAATSWLDAKVIAVAAGFGVPGIVTAGVLWVGKRRLKKRLKQREGGDQSAAMGNTAAGNYSPVASPAVAESGILSSLRQDLDSALDRLRGEREENARLRTAATEATKPLVINRDHPIPPQLVAEQREYVPVEIPQLEYEALRWSIDRYIKDNPSHRVIFEQIDGVANQYVSGQRNRRAVKNS